MHQRRHKPFRIFSAVVRELFRCGSALCWLASVPRPPAVGLRIAPQHSTIITYIYLYLHPGKKRYAVTLVFVIGTLTLGEENGFISSLCFNLPTLMLVYDKAVEGRGIAIRYWRGSRAKPMKAHVLGSDAQRQPIDLLRSLVNPERANHSPVL